MLFYLKKTPSLVKGGKKPQILYSVQFLSTRQYCALCKNREQRSELAGCGNGGCGQGSPGCVPAGGRDGAAGAALPPRGPVPPVALPLPGTLCFAFHARSCLSSSCLRMCCCGPLPEVLQGTVYFAGEAKKLWLKAWTGCAWLDSCFLLFWECLGRRPGGSLRCW